MSKYIYFTPEEKARAQNTDLVSLLRAQGERPVRSGREFRTPNDPSITVRGNKWFDHSKREGGYAVSFVQRYYCYVIELKGEVPTTSGRIGDLYTQVKQLYNMHQSKDIDNRINSLLKGLEKIVSAIAEMRNNSSDAHGVGQKRYNIEAHHARLFVNSAATMADFILAVAMRKPSIEQ